MNKKFDTNRNTVSQ